MKKLVSLILAVGVMIGGNAAVFAQSYDRDFPAYVPVSGGAWAEVNTSQGVATVVVPGDYIADSLGFTGTGYQLASVINTTINGTIYAQDQFGYYGSPESLQCRFTRMSGLEVYAPYRNSYGSTSYEWEELPTTEVLNTNIAFVDDTELDRQNDYYRYDRIEKLLILIFVVLCLLGVFKIFRRMWKA